MKRLWGELTADDTLRTEGEGEERLGARREHLARSREEFVELMDRRGRP